MTPIVRDLSSARTDIAARRTSASALHAACAAAADTPALRCVFIRRFDGSAEVAGFADAQLRVGVPLPPLAGLSLSVKDLFDVAGHPTTAGSIALVGQPAATTDCPAVARLRAAGAALVGHTNMTEFALSGVGINPHHGTPANPATARLDATPRIPGGSTSGGAVSVAGGAAWATLGSDTRGSLRIPAALQGLVGYKCTSRLVPTEGAVPLSSTLDTVGAITLSVRDAVLLHEILAQRKVALTRRPLRGWRLAIPETSMLDALDATVARAFDRSLAQLREAGAQIESIALPEIAELPAVEVNGSFVPAEGWAWHRELLARHEARYDPRVVQRLRGGQTMSAADYIDLQRLRRAWIQRMSLAMRGFDAMLSPTAPVIAPPIAELVASDEAFFAANNLLLRNTALVSMLDGCALSMPCQQPDEMPVGLMVWSTGMQDDTVLDVSLAMELALAGARA